MSDHFGIGQALTACHEIYFNSARSTGRTTSLANDVEAGDRIIVHAAEIARHLRAKLRDVGKEDLVSVVVIDPKNVEMIYKSSTSRGRTIFDHSWLEIFHSQQLAKTIELIDFHQTQSSGFGDAHRATQKAASEVRKWRY